MGRTESLACACVFALAVLVTTDAGLELGSLVRVGVRSSKDADVTSITQLVSRYTVTLDACVSTRPAGMDNFMSVWAADAVLDPVFEGFKVFGVAEIRRYYEFYRTKSFGPAVTDLQHHVTSTHIEEVDGDTATGTVYFFASGNMKGDEGAAFIIPGVYKDKYVRGSGGWLIKERQINVNFHATLPGAVRTFAPSGFAVNSA